MEPLPTLRRELITALALVFAGALIVAAGGIVLLLPGFDTPAQAAGYLGILLVLDVVIFAVFGRYLVQRRVLEPLERIVADVEAIAEGDYAMRIPPGDTAEVDRLANAVNGMAEHLIAHQEELAANIRSLEDTNRQLTEARDELIHAERMASVGRLAAGVAHEIGNPLSAIVGYLAVLGRGGEGNGPARAELLAAAEGEARRIDRIIHGLLDYARPREVRVQAMDINAVVEQTIDLLATQGRFGAIDVTVDLAPVPAVAGDPYQLQQALVNLLLNAGDALAGASAPALTVRTSTGRYRPAQRQPARRRDDPPDVDYSHRRRFHGSGRLPRSAPFPAGGQVVEIRIADNGPGIPPELMDDIFEPFVTTKQPGEGTGLGLAVAARLIDAMRGTIRVESPIAGQDPSRGSKGTAFTIVLPAATPVAGKDSRP